MKNILNQLIITICLLLFSSFSFSQTIIPSGTNGQLQYNNNGSFGGLPLIWDSTNNKLSDPASLLLLDQTGDQWGGSFIQLGNNWWNNGLMVGLYENTNNNSPYYTNLGLMSSLGHTGYLIYNEDYSLINSHNYWWDGEIQLFPNSTIAAYFGLNYSGISSSHFRLDSLAGIGIRMLTVDSDGVVNASNIKTINGNSLLGSGDISIASTSSFPNDITVNGLIVGKSGGNNWSNTALGVSALTANTTGFYNTAIGYQALPWNTTGASNTAVGFNSLAQFSTGVCNLVLGDWAGCYIPSGNANTIVGSHVADNISSNINNTLIIGTHNSVSIYSPASGNIILGGSTTDNGLAKLQVNGAINQSSVTSAMLKADINGTLVPAVAGVDYAASGGISGNGTANYIPYFNKSNSLSSSSLYYTGTNYGFGIIPEDTGSLIRASNTIGLVQQNNSSSIFKLTGYHDITKTIRGGGTYGSYNQLILTGTTDNTTDAQYYAGTYNNIALNQNVASNPGPRSYFVGTISEASPVFGGNMNSGNYTFNYPVASYLATLRYASSSTATIKEYDGLDIGGVYDYGGSHTITGDYVGFRFRNPYNSSLTNEGSTLLINGNVYGLYIEPSGGNGTKNFMAGDLKLGYSSYNGSSYALDINGSLRAMGALTIQDGTQGTGRILASDASGNASWQSPGSLISGWGLTGNAGTNSSTNFIGTTDSNDLVIKTNSTERLRVTSGGNVLIGKSSQINSAYKLDVAGNIRANKLVVNTNGADFVFDSSYQLTPLNEVSKYIQQNKHLPDIKSAKRMQEDGLDVGDNQTKLLQKIEELTLYMIELKKDNELLQQEIEALKVKLDIKIKSSTIK